MRTLLFVCLVICQSVVSPASTQREAQAQLQAKMQAYGSLYQAERYPEALRVLQEALAATEGDLRPWRPTVLYNIACVHARLGDKRQAIASLQEAVAAGYHDYGNVRSDTDFDSLRSESSFVALAAALREKFGPKPLGWDHEAPAAPFDLRFDAPELPQLVELRREFDLDPVVAGAKDDYERLQRLTAWASRRWTHGPGRPSHDDPLTILREAKQGKRFLCVHYSMVLAAAARAYGMPARVLGLMPADVGTNDNDHVAVEVWVARWKKWVLADGQFGTIATLDGTPLNAAELRNAVAVESRALACSVGAAACRRWTNWIAPYAYHLGVWQDQRLFEHEARAQLILSPLGAARPVKVRNGVDFFRRATFTTNADLFYAPPAASEATPSPGPAAAAATLRKYGLDPTSSIESRVGAPPASVLKMFADAGEAPPTVHTPTPAEWRKVSAAFETLPPLSRRILRERLRRVSFLDGLPGNGLTSTVNPDEPYKLFDITFRSGVLSETVSELVTRKERTCFEAAGAPLTLSIEAGTTDAILYVLLHESAHVVDASLEIAAGAGAGAGQSAGAPPAASFSDGIWVDRSTITPKYRDPLLDSIRYRSGGKPLSVDRASAVYTALGRTPFASLYASASWHDDLAELLAWYHLTEKLGQPYRIVVREAGKATFVYEPMRSATVRARLDQLKRFY